MSPLPIAASAVQDILIGSLSLLLIFSSRPNPKPPPPPPSTARTPTPFKRLKFTNIGMTSNNNKNDNINICPTTTTTTSLRFTSPESLWEWLAPRVPSDALSLWGSKPGTKNVHNLWLELSHGEISLADSSPPLRTVHVATLRVRSPSSPNLLLLESHQLLSDGSLRRRLRPLSEKMKPSESVESAALRAVREELGSVLPQDASSIRVVPGSYHRRVEERVSVSYPGLPARYVLHSVEVLVDGLPPEDFSTDEQDEYSDVDESSAGKAVFVRRHFWKWVDADDVAPLL